MSYHQDGVISPLNGKLLKFVDQFIYFNINIASPQRDVNIQIDKAWTTIYKIKAKKKSYLSVKIKREFFQAVAMYNLDSNETL